MLNRAFFSLQSAWIPTWVALGNLGLNAALDGAFYRLGIWGMPLSTSLVNIAGSAALLLLLRRRLGRIELAETIAVRDPDHRGERRARRRDVRCGGCSTAGSGDSFGAAWSRSWLALGGGLLGYLASCRLLGVRELETLLSLRRRRA